MKRDRLIDGSHAVEEDNRRGLEASRGHPQRGSRRTR
jgi:hypothetical protein